MTDLSKYPFIWCSQCEVVKPLLIDEMQADHLNAHDAADLMCPDCRSIIATLHSAPVGGAL